METINTAVINTPQAEFRAAIVLNKFVRLEYLTDLSEFIKADVLLKNLVTRDDADYLELGTGETIQLDRVVSIDGLLSPNYPGYANYSCDC